MEIISNKMLLAFNIKWNLQQAIFSPYYAIQNLYNALVAMKCVITMKPDQPFCGCSFGITNS